MRQFRRLRPSPALAISLVALFVSIGGVGYAAATVGTEDIEDGAVTTNKLHGNAVTSPKIANGQVGTLDLATAGVTGGKVENDSLTGSDIKESTLGTVPNADTTGGMTVQKFSATPAENTPLTTVATVGTLNLRFGCSANGEPRFTVTARSGAPEQGMKGSFIDGAEQPHSVASGTIPPEGVVVLNGNALSADGGVNAATANGQVTTVQWAARSSVLVIPGGPNPNPDHCFFYGTAISG
jgi:hypothetical protein